VNFFSDTEMNFIFLSFFFCFVSFFFKFLRISIINRNGFICNLVYMFIGTVLSSCLFIVMSAFFIMLLIHYSRDIYLTVATKKNYSVAYNMFQARVLHGCYEKYAREINRCLYCGLGTV
jgi:hypothetical protein